MSDTSDTNNFKSTKKKKLSHPNWDDEKNLKAFVEKADVEKICDMIVPKICAPEAPKLLDNLLNEFTGSPQSLTKRRKFITSVLTALQKSTVSSSHVNMIVNRIIMDLPSYPKEHLLKLVEFCQANICHNDDDHAIWKDLLPPLIEVIEEEKYINYNGNEVSGAEYKSLVVNSICNSHWDPVILTSLTKMFGEISLEKQDHNMIFRTLCTKLLSVNLSDIPPLVHQLLKLCQQQDDRLLVGTLRKYFADQYSAIYNSECHESESMDEIDEVSLKDIQDVESTVLFHIHQSAKLNNAYFKDFIRFLKTVINMPEYVLDPFVMAVLLTTADIYEDEIFELLRLNISRKIQDDEKRKESSWLRQMLPDTCNVMSVMEQLIDNSIKYRTSVVKSLVDLAFVLLGTDRKGKDDTHTSQLWDIGIKIVQKLVKKRHEIGMTVLQMLTEKIVAGGTSVFQYIECLAFMSRKLTVITLDSRVWIITLLEQLVAVPGTVAIQVLYAILPLLRVSSVIRDTLVLVLRKALYRKGTYTRQMAVIGFLQILKNLKLSALNALSQSSYSTTTPSTSSATSILTQVTLERSTQQMRSNPRYNATLCQEVLSILKRCFTHEVEVRLHLYEGLYDVILMNPELSEQVTQMLLSHFEIYFESDENVLPPLNFDKCTEICGAEVVLQEPIGNLIFILQKIYIKIASKDSSTVDRLAMTLESLCKRMAQTEMEHLHVDDQMDLLDNLPKSQQKLLSVKLMISAYEALISFKIGAWSVESTHMAQSINSLFDRYSFLVDFMKRLNKPKKGSGKKKDKNATDTINKKAARPGAIKLPKTIIDLDTMCKILSLLYLESVPWASKEQTTALGGRTNFHRFILNTCLQLLQNVKSLNDDDLRRHRSRYIKNYLEIGDLLYKQIISRLEEIRNFDQQTAVLGLECFKELCDVMSTSFSSDLPKFLLTTGEVEIAAGLNLQLQGLVSPLRVIVELSLEENTDQEEEVICKRIPLILLETISHLCKKMPYHQSTLGNEKVFDWLNKLARTQNVDANVAMTIINLMLMIEERSAEYGEVLNFICMQLCQKLGTIDKLEISMDDSFEIINQSVLQQTYNTSNTFLRYKLTNAMWLLARLKAEQLLLMSPGMDEEAYREKLRDKERSLCRQLAYVIQMLQTLANAAIEPGPSTDIMFKNLQLLYSDLKFLTKYFHGKSTVQNPAFQAVKFIQVVQLAGKQLKPTFYNLIDHTQKEQNTEQPRSTDPHAKRNKVLKETKIIPKVVLEIEQFNQTLMLLGKKTNIPLQCYMKQSVTRGFRIRNPELMEGIEKMNVSMLASTQASGHSTSRVEAEDPNSNSDGDEEL